MDATRLPADGHKLARAYLDACNEHYNDFHKDSWMHSEWTEGQKKLAGCCAGCTVAELGGMFNPVTYMLGNKVQCKDGLVCVGRGPGQTGMCVGQSGWRNGFLRRGFNAVAGVTRKYADAPLETKIKVGGAAALGLGAAGIVGAKIVGAGLVKAAAVKAAAVNAATVKAATVKAAVTAIPGANLVGTVGKTAVKVGATGLRTAGRTLAGAFRMGAPAMATTVATEAATTSASSAGRAALKAAVVGVVPAYLVNKLDAMTPSAPPMMGA